VDDRHIALSVEAFGAPRQSHSDSEESLIRSQNFAARSDFLFREPCVEQQYHTHTCADNICTLALMTALAIQRINLRILRPIRRPNTFKRSCFRTTADMSTASKTDVVKGKKEDMKGKNIVVTGANSGIGLALSKALVSRGAHVTVAARDNAKGAEYVLYAFRTCYFPVCESLVKRSASSAHRSLAVPVVHACMCDHKGCAAPYRPHCSCRLPNAGLSRFWKPSLARLAAVGLQMPFTLTCNPSSKYLRLALPAKTPYGPHCTLRGGQGQHLLC